MEIGGDLTERDAYQTVVSTREPRLVTIIGDAGVGKTRLVRELWEWLGAQAPEPLRASAPHTAHIRTVGLSDTRVRGTSSY